MKHTATVTAWATDDWFMGRLMEATDKGDAKLIVAALNFSSSDMTSHGWVKVGTAEITIDLLNMEGLASQQLATLEASLQKERADSQMRQNAILERISKLQALEFNGSPA